MEGNALTWLSMTLPAICCCLDQEVFLGIRLWPTVFVTYSCLLPREHHYGFNHCSLRRGSSLASVKLLIRRRLLVHFLQDALSGPKETVMNISHPVRSI